MTPDVKNSYSKARGLSAAPDVRDQPIAENRVRLKEEINRSIHRAIEVRRMTQISSESRGEIEARGPDQRLP